ncbi:hypothetical protein LBMAG42_40370 [Deltaproteobacteria bacterium]|nr:hypothetical protein LBMAG42_40370 [Deltaproteobacteria bacterium]
MLASAEGRGAITKATDGGDAVGPVPGAKEDRAASQRGRESLARLGGGDLRGEWPPGRAAVRRDRA